MGSEHEAERLPQLEDTAAPGSGSVGGSIPPAPSGAAGAFAQVLGVLLPPVSLL